MKKFFICATVVVAALLTACGGGSSDPKAVHEKIENNKELTQDDYNTMFEYTYEATKYMVDLTKNNDDFEQTMKASEEYNQKYPYVLEFGQALGEAEMNGKIDKKTSQEWEEKMTKLMEE